MASGASDSAGVSDHKDALDAAVLHPSEQHQKLPVTYPSLSGDSGASSSGSTNFGEREEMLMSAKATGARGISESQTPPRVPRLYMLTVPAEEAGERKLFEAIDVDLDSFLLKFKDVYDHADNPKFNHIRVPKIGEWWTPPLHDVEEQADSSLPDILIKEVDQSRDDSVLFMTALQAHGCQPTSIDEDFLLCFKDEEEMHSFETSSEKTGGPQHVSHALKSTLSVTSFYDQGQLVRPSTDDLKLCLDGVPETQAELGVLFMSLDDEAGIEVERHDWEKACAKYEECVVFVECMEDSIGIYIQTWLLLWVSIPLAHLYQTKLRNYPKCVTVYDKVLRQLNRKIDTLLYAQDQLEKPSMWRLEMVSLYFIVIWHRRLALFEWSYRFQKDGNLLLAQYIRSKAFSKIRVRSGIYFSGFLQLENAVYEVLGRNLVDMRVAFCVVLERSYRLSKQPEQAAEWTMEKWRWIRDGDISPDVKIHWELNDVRALYHGGRIQMAQSVLEAVEARGKNPTLPEIVSHRTDFWKACCLKDSDPKGAINIFVALRRKLGDILRKLRKAEAPAADEISDAEHMHTLVLLELSSLNVRGDSQMLDNAPHYVVQPSSKDEYWKRIDNESLNFLDEVRRIFKELKISVENPNFDHAHGQQLLLSLAKRYPVKDIEIYRSRLYEATDYITNCLEVFLPQVEVSLRSRDKVISQDELEQAKRTISGSEATYHELLGICCLCAYQFKPRGESYNVEDLANKEVRVYDEAIIQQGISHLEKALDLAVANGHDDIHKRVPAKLGWLHFTKAKEYHDRVCTFISDLMPRFRCTFMAMLQDGYITGPEADIYVKRDTGNPSHDHVYSLQLRREQLRLIYLQGIKSDHGRTTTTEWLKVGGYRPWFGIDNTGRPLRFEELTKALTGCVGLFLRGLMSEIKRSTDYFKKSFELGYGSIELEYKSQEQINQQLAPLLSTVEATKKCFTFLQRLMGYEVLVRKLIKQDLGLLRFVRCPETAEYLLSQPDDLTPEQKALLWSEAGRSRSLMCQLLANRLPDRPINSMVKDLNSTLTDQEAWAILTATRRSCGENTVFVEYTFDTTHEFVTDVMNDKKLVNWIAYVVTKEDNVHIRSSQTESPEESLEIIHKYLSRPDMFIKEGRDIVKKNLEVLYQVFISPISEFLRDMHSDDKLVFALDEVLNNVPFPILRNSTTGKYLFEEHTISFTPALRILVQCDQRDLHLQASATVAPSVALGNPTYPNSRELRTLKQIPSLMYTQEEIVGIQGPKDDPFFNDGCVITVSGTEATAANLLARVKLPPNTVQGFVHVAAHCYADEEHKSGSLVLAYDPNASKQDSPLSKKDADKLAKEKLFLRSEKIMQCGFEWRSHMAVLSACNSAKGYVLGSEGVVGLPRALLLAGVPCIVASQWKLHDKSSSGLMQEFYKEMSRVPCRDAASALQKAMLTRSKPEEGSSDAEVDVYQWGGYMVWGCPTVTLPSSMLKSSLGLH